MPSSPDNTGNLTEDWENAVIDLFVSLGDSFGFPRSMTQIFGLLYCSQEPLSMEDVMKRLQISKGSASQGLKQLSLFGAVKKQASIGERRGKYVAERSLKRLAGLFLQTHFVPRLQSGSDSIQHLRTLIPAGPHYDYARKSTDSLQNWHGKARRLLPTLTRLLQ